MLATDVPKVLNQPMLTLSVRLAGRRVGRNFYTRFLGQSESGDHMPTNYERITTALKERGGRLRGPIGGGLVSEDQGGGTIIWEYWVMPDRRPVLVSHTTSDQVALYAFVGEVGAPAEDDLAFIKREWGAEP